MTRVNSSGFDNLKVSGCQTNSSRIRHGGRIRAPPLRSADFQSRLYRGFPNPRTGNSSSGVGVLLRCRFGNRRYGRFGNLYSLSGVVHRLNRSPRICSAIQTVNNAVAMPNPNFSFQEKSPQCNFGLGSGTNEKPARSTSIAQSFDRSRNPNADTHSQVPTSTVSPYTACAPRSNRA